MSHTGVLGHQSRPSSAADTDYAKYIEEVLEEARAESVKSASEYREGYWAGLSDGLDEARINRMERVKRPASEYTDLFCMLLDKRLNVKDSDIVQCRFGLDYTTGVPTVLIILSQDCEDRLGDAMEMAAAFDLYMFDKLGHGLRCNFWVMSDGSLEQPLIDSDFPYYRGER